MYDFKVITDRDKKKDDIYPKFYLRGARLQTKVTCMGQHRAQLTDQCTEFLQVS